MVRITYQRRISLSIKLNHHHSHFTTATHMMISRDENTSDIQIHSDISGWGVGWRVGVGAVGVELGVRIKSHEYDGFSNTNFRESYLMNNIWHGSLAPFVFFHCFYKSEFLRDVKRQIYTIGYVLVDNWNIICYSYNIGAEWGIYVFVS